MIKNRDIIVIGIQPWDTEIGSNCKDIALEFTRQNRVLYVNSPLDRITLIRDKTDPKIQKRARVNKGLEPDLIKLSENFWNLYPRGMVESINMIKSPWLYNILNKRNNKIFAKAIQSAITRLDFKDFVLFNDSTMFLGLYMKELLKPALYVYYMRDYLIKNPYWKKHGVRLEPELISKADLVVNNSTLYANYGREFNKHSYMIGQGCDVSMFNDIDKQIEPAADLGSIPRPRIGYVGFLSSRRLDISLLAHIAKEKPDWHLVLVGPEDDAFTASELHGMANVHFLGSRDPSLLPGYIKGFDICMNPQIVNDATRGNYPRKIDEYLAMGKPTIATATEAMDYFRDHTYLASTREEYITLINKALEENTPAKEQMRRNFANQHSWENNVQEIYRYIRLVANEKGISL
ncbi:MAG: glycosyltransferase [Bacteroidetes bacterium]|nr:glycosyltransferase [Bacteroidota bacterium]